MWLYLFIYSGPDQTRDPKKLTIKTKTYGKIDRKRVRRI